MYDDQTGVKMSFGIPAEDEALAHSILVQEQDAQGLKTLRARNASLKFDCTSLFLCLKV
jgi:hypothetical protein